ncbi:MAG: acylphosphatase [Cyclobacteriaceae bacterium]|nr:acylphosphatase [Cyclobacteriaceae bacterium]
MGSLIKNVHLTITGRVQGVGFRYSALQKAKEHNIKGYVKNQYDGSVFIEAEGDGTDLDHYILWCHKGPYSARVEHVLQVTGKVKNHSSFLVKH